jgi:hypothetical protein
MPLIQETINELSQDPYPVGVFSKMTNEKVAELETRIPTDKDDPDLEMFVKDVAKATGAKDAQSLKSIYFKAGNGRPRNIDGTPYETGGVGHAQGDITGRAVK